MRIAVVIPTLNEAATLPRTLALLRGGARPYVLVVADCDSADATAALARDAGVELVHGIGLTSRAAALEAGWRRAVELDPDIDVIWFLHGDCLPPRGWSEAIRRALGEPGETDDPAAPAAVVGGAFTQRFNIREHRLNGWTRRRLRFVTFCNKCRYRLTGVYFGDQGIFVRRAALEAIGGVPQGPLMEDTDLCRTLRKHGRLCVSPLRISTSPRRFLRHGVIRQLLHDWMLLLGHRWGIRPQRLYQRYNADNRLGATPKAG